MQLVFLLIEAALEYPHWTNAKPGDVIFEDVSGDGTITVMTGSCSITLILLRSFYGVTVEATWKDFSFRLRYRDRANF